MKRVQTPLDRLERTDPWDWPEDAAKTLLGVLQNKASSKRDLLRALELAGDIVVISEELIGVIQSMLVNPDQPPEVRGRAAISLGPVLEYMDDAGDGVYVGADEPPISDHTFQVIKELLRRLYEDDRVSEEVRRRVLEASVRAPEDWHTGAIRTAYDGDDGQWKLTAVFCMQYVRGFERDILEALRSSDPAIRREAVVAAGRWRIHVAWADIVPLAKLGTEKALLLAVIEAVGAIRPREAPEILWELAESRDEDIAAAADETIGECLAAEGFDDESDLEDERE